MIDWLVTNALAALVLAAIAGAIIWTFRPAPAVRHALWLVVVLKLVAPGGPTVSVPWPVDPPAGEADVAARPGPADDGIIEAEVFTVWVQPRPGQSVEEAAALAMRSTSKADEATDARAAPAVTPLPVAGPPPARPFNFRPWLFGLWVAGAVLIGWRQAGETVRFARFARNARPAPDVLVAEVAVAAHGLGVRVPAVRVLARLTSPVMWCLGRPVLLWPAGLECRLKGDGRRAVIAHELAHLRRRDHWVRRLEMVAAVLHWWNPLFWVARKKLRADAELACDAWAAGQADRRAYAEALLEVCSFNPRRRPAPAVGVFGEGRRAMQERLTMIMRDRAPCRLAFGAKLVVALMAIAAVPAWTLGQSKPVIVADDEIVLKVGDAVEDGDDGAATAIQAQIQALSQKLEALKAAKAAGAEKKATEKLKAAQGKLGEKVRELRVEVDARGGQGSKTVIAGPVKVLTAGHDGVKVIGPDGKEIQGARVIIGGAGGQGGAYTVKPMTVQGTTQEPKRVEVKVVGADGKSAAAPHAFTGTWTAGDVAKVYLSGAGGGNAITLSRATYKLNQDQATALATLLGSIKATVMETKADGDSLTVTTTPEAQATIGQIVRLIQGQGGPARIEWKLAPGGQNLFVPATPAAPGVPAKPGAPARPSVPAKPGEASAAPEGVDVEVILKQLKLNPAVNLEAGGDMDAARLHELLKALKPLEFKLKAEKAKKESKPDGEKK